MQRPSLLPSIVFIAAWLIYQSVIPLILVTWKITGDEPHYLLAAHSLAYDHDLDLKNNYLNGDHVAFFPFFLDPHVREQPDGAWLLTHDLGLPILIAPAYALGGRRGVMEFFAVLGAGLAAQMFLLGWEVSGRWWIGLLSGLVMAFSAPLSLYVFQVYPEMTGGLIVLWATRQILETKKRDKGAVSFSFSFSLSLSLAFLPWLSGRFMPLMLGLAALTAWKQRRNHRLWVTVAAATAISLTVYLLYNFAHYGGPTPSATPSGNAVTSGFGGIGGQQIGRGLAGWWLDQQRGLLIYGPALVLALIGLPHLWRLRRWEGLILFAPIALMWLLASVWGGFFIAWEISARFLIVGVPLMTAGIAAVMSGITLEKPAPNYTNSRKPASNAQEFVSIRGIPGKSFSRAVLFWPLAAGLITLNILNAVIVVLDPFTAFHESPVTFYEAATGQVLRSYFPAAGTRFIELPPEGAEEWTARQGQPGYLHQSAPISELSIGWYRVYAQAQLTNAADPNAVALLLEAFSSEAGIPLFQAEARPRDADPATGLVDLRASFYNPYIDRWDFPFYLDIRTTGASDVRLSRILFEPDPLPTYGRMAAWMGGIMVLIVAFAWRTSPPTSEPV